MAIKLALLIVGAYLVGSIPAAYLVTRWARGIDIRQYGSGNVGTSNVLRVTSKWLSLPVLAFDLGKGMLVVWMAKLVDLSAPQQVMVGLAAITGHNWPVFLHFKGGRGLLTTLGVVFVVAPKLAAILLAVALSGLPFGQMAVTGMLAAILLPISSWFFASFFGISEPFPVALSFSVITIITLIRRLAAPRTALSAAMPWRQILINRLLLDRDIRDRKAWIHQAPSEIPPQPESPKKG